MLNWRTLALIMALACPSKTHSCIKDINIVCLFVFVYDGRMIIACLTKRCAKNKSCPPRAQCFIYKRTNGRRHQALLKKRQQQSARDEHYENLGPGDDGVGMITISHIRQQAEMNDVQNTQN